jgi:hypothetical protein
MVKKGKKWGAGIGANTACSFYFSIKFDKEEGVNPLDF